MTEREMRLREALKRAVAMLQWTGQEPGVIAGLWREISA
jgi:hypothetical protein